MQFSCILFSNFILLTLRDFLTAKYILVEVKSHDTANQRHVGASGRGISARGGIACGLPANRKKGKCDNLPVDYSQPARPEAGFPESFNLQACIAYKMSFHDFLEKFQNHGVPCDVGNYLMYNVGGHTLELDMVYTEFCNPKPKDCGCSTLLSRALDENPSVTTIMGTFAANPWEYGCKCYLGEAARHGFRYVKLEHPKKDICNDVRSFNDVDYREVCANYGRQKCDHPVKMGKSMEYPEGIITITEAQMNSL